MRGIVSSTPALFQPIKIGAIELKHRVVLAPLTQYYTQRTSRPGTLLITEATFIAPRSQEQIDAWKEITDSVHEKGSYIYLQLWAIGRAANPDVLKSEGIPFVAPSPIPLKSQPTSVPRELTLAEIQTYPALYAKAALNAREAGFDGVEVHGANGYLIDQFLQDVSNQRTDTYGGSIENRSRFGLEVVKAVVDAIGADRVGIRLSPWSTFQDMRMDNPVPQFTHFTSTLKYTHPDLAYLHVVEPKTARNEGITLGNNSSSESNDFLRAIWSPKPLIKSALIGAQEKGDIIAFGRRSISNPDLVYRLENNIPLTQCNRATFYVPAEDPKAAGGYIDYPFATTEEMEPVRVRL
ncbi:hypothetical protein BDQ17DRAFT_1402557 [Cyathus striatus]|nr:hypothetical protein BDQ17DRAFT_1402557 [Cyathus striatus]